MLRLISERGLRKYLEEISHYPILDKKEEFQLGRKIRDKKDEAAKEKMILSNLRIVVYIAKKFQNQGMTLSELINSGNEGLIQAVGKFDERKGYRFSTYSVWWIKRSIYEAINAQRGIMQKSFLARRIQQVTSKFIRDNGREPTLEDLAEKLRDVDQKTISLALTELIPPYSLDETYDSDEMETPYLETVRLDIEGSDNLIAPPPDEIFKKKVEKERLEKALKKLPPREQEVLKRNFGMGDYDTQSMEDISRIMNITRERVRQIRDNALRKLKIILLKQDGPQR